MIEPIAIVNDVNEYPASVKKSLSERKHSNIKDTANGCFNDENIIQ